ncbi:MAG TPA: peptidoglycan-binding protein [Chthoniobacterales bacterium]|nr:peptidoglycan-binding protein [Chthoniobacterales bacterium]
MKRTLITLISILALSVGAYAEKKERASSGGGKERRAAASAAKASRGAQVQRSRQVNTRQSRTARSFQRQNVAPRSVQRQQRAVTTRAQSREINRQSRITSRQNRVTDRNNRITARQNRRAETVNNRVVNANNRRQALREQRATNREQRAINRQVDRNHRIVNRTRNINRNVRVVNNWRGERFAGRDYVAFRNYRRQWHDRHWWHHHHNRIVFVLGGWYFWNSGYWYPAWGYDPGYVYPYDGPIYGYGDLTPDQIVVNVQLQLRDNGYYFGAIDGLLGPQTRQALAAFQADNGLAITSAVDEPTLATMGLV